MSDQPNVLLISADHWSGRLGGWAGNSSVLTPTLDHLARGGVSFRNAYSACPVCVPARRTLMTGMSARAHGVRSNSTDPMPDASTMAQCFQKAGYQTFAVGKLHVTPQRNRIGFDDVLACEEGRHPLQAPDDWEMFLEDRGYGHQQYSGAGTQNDYLVTPWHLPDDCHPTHWSAREMARTITRRDPNRPAFWYLSFIAPHPPLWPLASYLQQYSHLPVSEPPCGDWMEKLASQLPPVLRSKMEGLATSGASAEYVESVQRAFYAMMTQIDHQIRMVLGTLSKEGLAQNTIVAFTSDHGDMLGQHGLWGKCLFYEDSCRIPLVVTPPRDLDVGPRGRVEDRLVELADVMPSLLTLCGLPVPETVEGTDVFSGPARTQIFGEYGDGLQATRMVRQGRYKLIYYPTGNHFHLFDLEADPEELEDLFGDLRHEKVTAELQDCLAAQLDQADQEWICDGRWVGLPLTKKKSAPDLGCRGQRGYRF
jgi:arylsulfatase A-like enzyme